MNWDAFVTFYIALAPLVRYDEELDRLMPTEQAIQMSRGIRSARFRKLNDRIWGEGNWIQCRTCPKDSAGFEVFHSVQMHELPEGTIGVAMTDSIQDPFTGEVTVEVKLL